MKNEFNVKIQNIVAFTSLGKPVKLKTLIKNLKNTQYNPKEFPGLVYRINNPRAAALIFSQGKIVCTGTKSIEDLELAMQKIVDKIKGTGIPVPKEFHIKKMWWLPLKLRQI